MDIDAIEKDHGIPEGLFSLSVASPVPLIPGDAELQEAWGCFSIPHILQPWKRRTPTWGFINFKVLGGPPTAWLRKMSVRYPHVEVWLRHATEATAVAGHISYAGGICTIHETLGDDAKVEREIHLISGMS
jgi:hypothetical protein